MLNVWGTLHVGLAAVALAAMASGAHAQTNDARSAAAVLPDAPQPGVSSSSARGYGGDPAQAGAKPNPQDNPPRTIMATTFDKVIDPSEIAPKLGTGDKILIGMRSSVSLFTIAGWFGSSLYSQAIDGSPNYGQNFHGYAQRLGAVAARDASEDMFTDAVFAPILHEDPRYYVMGTGHRGFKRALYAVTRVVFTKTDSGAQTVNVSLLVGNLAGSTLTQLYYPPVNRSVRQVAETWGGSLGGSAFGDLFKEFFTPTAERLGLKHQRGNP